MKVVLATLPAKIFLQDIDSIKTQTQNYGAQIKLEGIAPRSYTSFFYQILTGLGPAWTNIYDDVRVKRYDVLPTPVTENIDGRMVWDLVQSMGKTFLQTNSILSAPLPEFVHLQAQTLDELATLLKLTDKETVKVVILPDCLPQRHYKKINVNNFFEANGLLERTTDGNIQWAETLAYYAGYGQVRINLAGREPKGVVAPGQEYNQVRLALVEMLQEQFVDPDTNQFVVERVWQKEELYAQEADCFVHGSDLVLTFQPGYIPSAKSIHLKLDEKDILVDNRQEFQETPDSFSILVWGNGIKQEYSTSSHTLDIVPTLLYLLNLPIPQIFNGKVVEDIFLPEFLDNHPVCYQTEGSLTTEEEALLIDRLEALGYID